MHFSTSARKWGMFNLPALRGVKWKSKLLTVPKESTQIKSEWGILYRAEKSIMFEQTGGQVVRGRMKNSGSGRNLLPFPSERLSPLIDAIHQTPHP